MGLDLNSCIGTNTYLIGNGPRKILIDTGEGRLAWITALRQVLAEEKATIVTAIITHWHRDHVSGVPHLREACPDVVVYKNQPDHGQHSVEDGQKFFVDGATLRAVHSPGHTNDHMSLLLEEEDAMFTGDNLLGQGTAVFEDLRTYISSLERMQGMFSGRAYPGHGPVIEDGKTRVLEYIQHRQKRENQVIECLNLPRPSHNLQGTMDTKTGWTSMELVREIYKDIPTSLHGPANGGVVQVLRKLEDDGIVVQDLTSRRWGFTRDGTL